MTSYDGSYKFGVLGRNERFSFAVSINCRDGDDLVRSGNLVSAGIPVVSIVGG